MTPFFLARKERIGLQISVCIRIFEYILEIQILFSILWDDNIELRRGSEKCFILCSVSNLSLKN